MLAMIMAGLLMPGLSGTATAQDAGLCEAANGLEAGTPIGGYTVAYGSGGAGKQVVLGYGEAYLSGGSGNDVICAWNGFNTLDGGSGNDTLIVMSGTGNTLRGGSGNDTMIGHIEDVFDGGSGRNTTIQQDLSPEISVVWTVHGTSHTPPISGTVTGTGLQPGADMYWVQSRETERLSVAQSIPMENLFWTSPLHRVT